MKTLARWLVLTALIAPAARAEGPEAIARYKFLAGQEIRYKTVSSFKYGEGDKAGEFNDTQEATVRVVRKNRDGSYHLVVRWSDVSGRVRNSKAQEAEPAEVSTVYADVFDDGRVVENQTIRYRGSPFMLFPRLPADAKQIQDGWKTERQGDTISAGNAKGGKGKFSFDSATESVMDKIYLSTNTSKVEIDTAKGFVSRITSENSQGYGFKGKGGGSTELVEVKAVPADEMKAYAEAADAFFQAKAAYDAKKEAAGKAKPDEAKKLLDEAAAGLKASEESTKHAEFKAALANEVKQHERMGKYTFEEIERKAKFMGQAAFSFATKDIDGKDAKLEDYKGKVVVLDFWYRGCGWCVKAMPQMNQLCDDFAGKPVAILGMNTDQKPKDAKFVMEKMGLKYPTLKGDGLPEKYGVSGFPTLIIIDKQGLVADIHVGYSPTLREEVGRKIREVAAAKD